MNQVALIGRLTKDPELFKTEGGKMYSRFNIAIDRRGPEGEREADFPRIVVWGKQAENCVTYLGKGRLVAISGRISTGQYDHPDGHRVFVTEVNARYVEFLDFKESESTEIDEALPF